jgi:phosphoribosyl 1,2-cyclic phosphate phosphodiesterase
MVIDVSADFRQQALREKIDRLDALLITHCHADHVFGLDDIRPINFRRGPVPVYGSEDTWRGLRRIFSYIFDREHVGGGLPQLVPHVIEGAFETCGSRRSRSFMAKAKSPASASATLARRPRSSPIAT